jgi:hypothetical protein
MNHEHFNESRWFHTLPSMRYTYVLSCTRANSCDSVSKRAPWLQYNRLSGGWILIWIRLRKIICDSSWIRGWLWFLVLMKKLLVLMGRVCNPWLYE